MGKATIHVTWRSAFTARLGLTALAWFAALSCLAVDQLFAPPAPAIQADEILLVSTRAVGTSCQDSLIAEKLQCQRFEIDSHGRSLWKPVPWREALLEPTSRRTVIYVHGNRVEPGKDRMRGMEVYNSLVAQGKPSKPVRYVIWSWPATTIPGPLKDVHVKAARTRPAGWQLAWFLDQLPEETPVSLVGYSYGARVISGALHLLGGGKLNSLELAERMHPGRPAMRVAMIAAAYDADWLQPGGYHERAVSQMEELVLFTNHRDPAMRLYHLSVDRGRINALGMTGVPRPSSLGDAAERIVPIDVAAEVGRSHMLEDYLRAHGKMSGMWRRVLGESKAIETAESTLAESIAPSSS